MQAEKIKTRKFCRVFDNRTVCFFFAIAISALVSLSCCLLFSTFVVVVIAKAKQTFSFLINFYALLSFCMLLFYVCMCMCMSCCLSYVRSIFLDFVLKFRSRSRSRFFFFQFYMGIECLSHAERRHSFINRRPRFQSATQYLYPYARLFSLASGCRLTVTTNRP